VGVLPRVVPMLPCGDVDEIVEFFTALGFAVTYRQVRLNPYVAFEGHGFPIHYWASQGIEPRTPTALAVSWWQTRSRCSSPPPPAFA